MSEERRPRFEVREASSTETHERPDGKLSAIRSSAGWEVVDREGEAAGCVLVRVGTPGAKGRLIFAEKAHAELFAAALNAAADPPERYRVSMDDRAFVRDAVRELLRDEHGLTNTAVKRSLEHAIGRLVDFEKQRKQIRDRVESALDAWLRRNLGKMVEDALARILDAEARRRIARLLYEPPAEDPPRSRPADFGDPCGLTPEAVQAIAGWMGEPSPFDDLKLVGTPKDGPNPIQEAWEASAPRPESVRIDYLDGEARPPVNGKLIPADGPGLLAFGVSFGPADHASRRTLHVERLVATQPGTERFLSRRNHPSGPSAPVAFTLELPGGRVVVRDAILAAVRDRAVADVGAIYWGVEMVLCDWEARDASGPVPGRP